MSRTERLADGAGVVGAAFAALCCAGTPLIVSALTATGLGFLRRDALLLPLMFASLAVALWGFWRGRRLHGSAGPLLLAISGAAGLIAGVLFIHGFPATEVIWAGAAALAAASLWNVIARRRCAL
ncbi:MAG: MerC domain-containing protein [Gemmatimonadaceae bacterium]|nr:MerC domain-containing protein [Gemmatimonadaceae bacterium]